MTGHQQLLSRVGLNPSVFRVVGVRYFTDGKPAAPPEKKRPRSNNANTQRVVTQVLNSARWVRILDFEVGGISSRTARTELDKRIADGEVIFRGVPNSKAKEYGWAKWISHSELLQAAGLNPVFSRQIRAAIHGREANKGARAQAAAQASGPGCKGTDSGDCQRGA